MQHNQNGEDDKPKGDKAFDYVLSGLAFLIGAIGSTITGNNTSEDDEKNANYEIANWTRVVGRWTRGLVIVGVFTVPVLGLQSVILYNQLTEMRDETRAWIAPRVMRIGDVSSGHEITLSLNYGNVGKEPATKVGRIAEKFATYDPAWTKPENAMQDFIAAIEAKTGNASCKIKSAERYLGTLYPGPPESYNVQAIAPPEWADKILQNLTFIVRGCFHYETMGIERYSGYCFWHNQATPQKDAPDTLRYCPTGNDAY